MADTLGSPAFWAPECLQPAKFAIHRDLGLDMDEETVSSSPPPPQFVYSAYALDVWAYGLSLFAMVFGDLPFPAKTTVEMFDEICRREIDWSRLKPSRETVLCEEASLVALHWLMALLQGLLVKEPAERWSLQNAVDFLLDS